MSTLPLKRPSTAFESKTHQLQERMTARLRLRHLRLLSALSRSTTLLEAAQEVGVTQPAASQALREIEDMLEVQLFERHARGLRATPAGRFMAEQSRLVLGSVGHAAQALAAASLGLERPLQLCAIPAALSGLLRPRLPQLRKRMAGIQVSIHECTPEQTLEWLQAGTMQLALTRQPEQDLGHRLVFTPLLDDELIVVAAPEHPACRRKSIDLAELGGYPWSMPVGPMRTAQVFQEACREAGLVPTRAGLHSISSELLLGIVADHQTLVAAPRSIVGHWVAAGDLQQVRLRRKIVLPPLGALHQADEASKTVGRVIEVLKR